MEDRIEREQMQEQVLNIGLVKRATEQVVEQAGVELMASELLVVELAECLAGTAYLGELP